MALSAHPLSNFGAEPKIAVQNSILTKVNGKTISMMDVKKKMDMAFHQNYPHLTHSNPARVQFYEVAWKKTLMDMIDNELILSDATDKEINLNRQLRPTIKKFSELAKTELISRFDLETHMKGHGYQLVWLKVEGVPFRKRMFAMVFQKPT